MSLTDLKSFRTLAAFVAAIAVLTLTGTAIPAQAQTYTDLHDFNPGAGDPHTFSESKLAQGRDGDFYAESNGGGTGNGTVFRVSPSGTVTVIHSFDGTDGSNAIGGMTLGTDGNLYGETWSGGSFGNGITFKITPSGTETALHNFANTGDGANPANVLVAGSGLFYGTTNAASADTVYKVTPAGALTTLHTFSSADGQSGGQLFLGSDGNIYGGMNQGGQFGFGTAFKMTPTGVYKVLHNFNNTDGNLAAPGLVQMTASKFYGTTELGGTTGDGVVYSITSTGAFSVLHNFSSATDGHQALTLTLANDGNAYGVAVSGGSANCGTIFKVTAAGAFSVVHTFDNTHGCNPLGGYLTQGTDGKLYGLANAGGAHSNGVFFSLDMGLSPFVTLTPTSGKVGTKVGIMGQGFDSASVVEFGGVKATSITLTGTTYIVATVPTGAVDGKVTVTTGSTTLTSTQTFIVHDSWSSGAAIPTAVQGPATGVIGSNVYVVGGATNSNIVDINQIYNTATNKWTTGASMPTPRFAVAGAVVNGILYVIGGNLTGGDPLDVVEAYNPTTNTWSTKSPMPTPRDSLSAVVDKGIIYVIGGYNNTSIRLATVESYNPATNTWKEEAPLAVPKSSPAVGLLGTTIVAADGFLNSGMVTGDNEGYNPATNTWRTLAADPNPRQAGCSASILGLLYVAGGTKFPPLSVNESFNLATDKWTTLKSIPVAAVLPGSATVNNLLYCIGGSNNGSVFQGSVYNNVQIYQP
jgi:uncharacterized repeat protein (TIGR03803 family)